MIGLREGDKKGRRASFSSFAEIATRDKKVQRLKTSFKTSPSRSPFYF